MRADWVSAAPAAALYTSPVAAAQVMINQIAAHPSALALDRVTAAVTADIDKPLPHTSGIRRQQHVAPVSSRLSNGSPNCELISSACR
jgi:hypothetical protein